MIRRFPRLAAIVVLVMAAATACSSTSGQSAGGANSTSNTNGGVLRLGTLGTFTSFNPFVTQDTLSQDIFEDIYPHLLQYDLTTKQLSPDFATKWVTSGNGKELTFTLLSGAKWSDGKSLDATDVAWTLNTMIKFSNGPTALWLGAIAGMKKAVASDSTTVQISFSTPVPNDTLAQISTIPILPPQVWAQYAGGTGQMLTKVTNLPTANQPLVSGGAFTFIKYTPKQAMLFQTNPNYYGAKPHIDGFGVELFSNDDAEIAALKGNQIDGALAEPSLPPADAAPIKSAGLRIVEYPSLSFNDLIINSNSKMTSHRELLNPLVREALEYATDRQQILQIIMLGHANLEESVIGAGTGAWHNPNVPVLPFDIAKANQLLDQAGYARGSDGIRVADGHPMSYQLLVSPDNVGGLRTAQLIAQTYTEIGIQLDISQPDDDALENAILNNNYTTFQMVMWGWDTELDPTYMLNGLTCAQYGNYNDSGYCNSNYDKLFAIQSTATDQAKRQQIVYQMQAQLAVDRPYIVLYYQDVLEGWSNSWSKVVEGPTGFLSWFSNSSLLTIHRV